MEQEYNEAQNQENVISAQIEAKAEEAMEKVQAFFAQYGIELKMKPKIKYLDTHCPINNRAAGVANVGIEPMKKMIGLVGRTLTKAMYKYFDLQVSDEAIDEGLGVLENEFDTIFKQTELFTEGEDIDLFLPIQNMLEELDSVLVHECWHLHENAQGVLDKGRLICEATATYVQNLFMGKTCKNPIVEDSFDVMYKRGAAIVEEELERKENPLIALLQADVRKKIESRFRQEVLPLFEEKIVLSFNPHLGRSMQKKMIETHPAYEAFRKAPSAENLLHALKQRGYVKLAEDFSKQDMRKLLEYSQAILKENEAV